VNADLDAKFAAARRGLVRWEADGYDDEHGWSCPDWDALVELTDSSDDAVIERALHGIDALERDERWVCVHVLRWSAWRAAPDRHVRALAALTPRLDVEADPRVLEQLIRGFGKLSRSSSFEPIARFAQHERALVRCAVSDAVLEDAIPLAEKFPPIEPFLLAFMSDTDRRVRFDVPFELVRRRDDEHEHIELTPAVLAGLTRLCDDPDESVAAFARRWFDPTYPAH
jgi:hypothetical protein